MTEFTTETTSGAEQPPETNPEVAAADAYAVMPVQRVLALFAELKETLSSKQRLTEQSFNLLYQDLENYRRDFLGELVRPLLLDLLLFRDNLQAMHTANQGETREALSTLLFELEETLGRQDLVLTGKVGERMDRKTCRAIRTIETDDPEKEDLVAEVLKDGFLWRERVLRPAQVAVFRRRGGSGA